MKKEDACSGDIQPMDFNMIINKLSQQIQEGPLEFTCYEPDDNKECQKFMTKEKNRGLGYVVVGSDIGIELGPPSARSFSHVLWTKQDILMKNGIWIGQKDNINLKKRSGPLPFLQMIILHLDKETAPDDASLKKPKNLTNKIPGFMARTLPGKSWVRIHKKLLRKDFSLYSLGQCIYQSYKESISELVQMNIILSVDERVISELEPLCRQVSLKQSENHKKRLEKKGIQNECNQLNCDACEERTACDVLKYVVAGRREQ